MSLLLNFKKQFDNELGTFLNKKIKSVSKIDRQASDLLKIINEFVENGGKRFRPAIYYYAFSSYSSKSSTSAIELSQIFELFHSYILIHDDIIDNSNLRRGKQTVHKKYDISTAILAGDLSLMLADEIFSHATVTPKTVDLYNEFKQELLIGEYLDSIKIDDIDKIMELKTARYSFIKPALIAFSMTKADDQEIKKWEEILREAGILFQIKDDFDGTFGNEKVTGKPVDSDIKEGKNTLLIERFISFSNSEEKKRFYAFFGRSSIKNSDLIWYKKILIKYGIDGQIKKEIKKRTEEIEKKLNRYFPDKILSKFMKEILNYFQS